jgi:hypothetical protein
VIRVLTILVRYGTDIYPDAEERVAEIYRRQMPDVVRAVVVVDNALPVGYLEGTAGRRVIGGDNVNREFSGFDRALAFLADELWAYDLVHFVTDAFHTLYVDYLARFDTALLRAIVGKAVCVGHIDCYNEPIEILSFVSQYWIRSCFFYMSPGDAKTLRSLVTVRDGASFFSGDPLAPFRVDAPLNDRYQRYLIDWITGQDIGQGVAWHSSFGLTRDTLPSLERKSVSIMNEHLLRIRISAMGCRVIDVTWLATALARGGPFDVAWNTPWQAQLAGRAREALFVPASVL